VSWEESDTAYRDAERPPTQCREHRVDLLKPLFRYLADEFQGDMDGLRRYPTHVIGQRPEFALNVAQGFPNFIWQIDGDEDSHAILITSRRTISNAACDACQRTLSRSPGKRKRRSSVPAGVATAMCTVPTGFSAEPPPGPATPVTPTPIVVPARARIPSARPRATSMLTAPCISSSSGGIPANSIFDSLL